ncbi:MAG: hypothetical protein AAF518_10175, partial [Spirochaetota bacterium]
FAYGSYNSNFLAIQSFLIRKNINFLIEHFERYDREVMQEFNLHDAIIFYQMFHQFVLNLSGNSEDILVLKGRVFDELQIIPIWIKAEDISLTVFYSKKAMLSYLFGDKKDAFNYFEKSMPFMDLLVGMMLVPEFNFFHSLTCLALLHSEDYTNLKKSYIDEIKSNQEKMKIWGENCPANYGHKYHIVEGEWAAIHGDVVGVIEHFNKAIVLAKEHEYLFEEAIANEVFAEFWEKQENESLAKTCRIEAHYAYLKWGCIPKCEQLEEAYPYLKRKQYQS